MVDLSIAVMTHPARPDVLDRLVGDLRGMGVEPDVVSDPDPFNTTNPWRCAREAWRRTPDDCTHRVLLQDDALVCDEFPLAAAAAITAQPGVIVSFFVNWIGNTLARAQMDACERCLAWARLPYYGWYPTVAVAMPRAYAHELAEFPVPEKIIADDVAIARYANDRRRVVMQTVPSLVQHDEEATSTVAGHVTYRQSRAAACFLGDADWRLIDWSRS